MPKIWGTRGVEVDLSKVNNAGGGIAQGVSIFDLRAADVEKSFAVNTYSTLYAVQAVASHMPRGGRIVNIGSVISRVRNAPGLAVYGASKAAQEYLTGAMSYEVW
jgi:NAD(P)-dependent dehydrogenase (short-subunit alcohol dehydrogenase family)